MLNPSELADGVKIPKSQPPNPASNSVLLFDEVQSNLASNEIDKNSLSGSIWTVSNGTKNPSRLTTSTIMDDDRSTIEDEKDPVEGNEFYDDDDDDESVPDTKIIFDKEFEDYFEDRIHKSGSSMIFMSKTLGLLPVIWTEEDLEGECKTYLNFYTFILYICWVALFVLTFIKLNVSTEWPSDTAFQHYMNKTNNGCVVLSSATFQANLGGQWISAILIVSCGILNSRSLADVFYSLSGVDSLLDLKEKQYSKLNRKIIWWCIFYIFLWAGHGVTVYYLLEQSKFWHLLYFFSDVASYGIPIAYDLQYIFLCLSLRKRYRTLNKQLCTKTKIWRLPVKPSGNINVLQNILQYRFDQIFEPKQEDLMKTDIDKQNVPMDLWLKDEPGPNYKMMDGVESKPTKEEEQSLIAQLESLRCAYVDLGDIIQEMNNMFSTALFSHLIALSISFIVWAYLNLFAIKHFEIVYTFIGLCVLAFIRIFLVCCHAQNLKHESRKPLAGVCQITSVDGSPKLERLLVKMTSQMYYNQPTLSCGDYFPLGQRSLLVIFSVSIIIAYILFRIHGFQFNYLKEESILMSIQELLKKLDKN